MSQRRRGLVITNLFPNAAEQTRGTFVYQETQRLRERYELKVIAPLPWVPPILRDNKRYGFHAAPAREEMDGLEVFHPRHIVIPRVLRSLYGPFLVGGLRSRFRRLLREFRPEFVVAHYAFPDGYAARELCRGTGLPLLIKARGSDINLFMRSWARRRLTLGALRAADRVVTVSAALRDRMRELGLERDDVIVVNNGIDAERFAPRDRAASRAELGLEPEPFTFLFIGYLRGIKGVFTLLQAFRAIPEEERRQLRLVIIGEGDLAEAVARRVVRFGMSGQVRVLPFVPHAQVPLWLGACDCLVLPSIMEGYPNVLVEALAAERPVIASRVGGIPEIVTEGRTGLLVQPSDPWQLTDAMRELARGFEFDVSAASAARRSWEDVAREMTELIEGMIAGRRGGTA